jgi:hypothetical protein
MSDLLQQMASASTSRDEALASLRIAEERAQKSHAAQGQAEEAMGALRAKVCGAAESASLEVLVFSTSIVHFTKSSMI